MSQDMTMACFKLALSHSEAFMRGRSEDCGARFRHPANGAGVAGALATPDNSRRPEILSGVVGSEAAVLFTNGSWFSNFHSFLLLSCGICWASRFSSFPARVVSLVMHWH